MSNLKNLSMLLLAVTTISAPAMARESRAVAQQTVPSVRSLAQQTTRSAVYVPDADTEGRVCVPAPRVGAFATAPWSDSNIPCEP
ncbi:hypothetical protein [Bradyrhizobium sp. CER78]|uniref:hypothetical protein n=1 Tax=Bradyrhizobium sp. CER78 TaxID=3039162 RepID=UPI00244A7F6F|nr:hypothetical protein [Bradyrhizobium sp. CER78]MDH2384939.1 hypothetical protein [Bradyrhizobium sp. CER78]